MATAADSDSFWCSLDKLVGTSQLVIERTSGTAHPRFPDFIYPYDYGYLEGTSGGDGNGIDVWLGSLPERRLVGVICTVDMLKRDAEVKLLIGCTPEEMQAMLAVHNGEWQRGLLIERPSAATE